MFGKKFEKKDMWVKKIVTIQVILFGIFSVKSFFKLGNPLGLLRSVKRNMLCNKGHAVGMPPNLCKR
jgi:hypothetical protein